MTAGRLYVGTIGEGIWRSTDGGRSFTRLFGGLFVECHVRALVVHPQNDRHLYLGTESGLYQSTDGGDEWQPFAGPLAGKQVWSVVVLPSDPRVIVAGTCPPQLIRSEDGGKTWEALKTPMRQECPRIMWNRVTTLAADAVDKATIWAGVEIDGPRRSDDAGLTWTECREGLSSQDIHSLVVVPDSGSPSRKRLIASTNNDVNVSGDNGTTWKPMGLGTKLPYPYFRGMGQKADDRNVIFLGNGDGPPGTIGGPARSADGGLTWQAMRMPAPANGTIWNFATHPSEPRLVYCNSVNGQVYQSADAGESWQKLPREFGEIRALAWTP